MRMQAQTATIEAGRVRVPREARWVPDYLHELAVFPRGRHDDQVDPSAQALAFADILVQRLLGEQPRHHMTHGSGRCITWAANRSISSAWGLIWSNSRSSPAPS